MTTTIATKKIRELIPEATASTQKRLLTDQKSLISDEQLRKTHFTLKNPEHVQVF